jgi:hypothetical protein
MRVAATTPWTQTKEKSPDLQRIFKNIYPDMFR